MNLAPIGDIERMISARGWLIQHQLVPLPLADVSAYFQEPTNLQHLTPRWLDFRIEEVPIGPLTRGSRISYRLSLFGLPMRWRTLIERSNPGWGFVDTQAAGPYRSWIHTHTFAERNGEVLVEDRVDYEVPYGPVGFLAAPFIRLQLAAIFRYRRARLNELAAAARQPDSRGRTLERP